MAFGRDLQSHKTLLTGAARSNRRPEVSDPNAGQRSQPEPDRGEEAVKDLEVRDEEMAKVQGGVENPTVENPTTKIH
jgi:hypothetical protein